MPSTTLLATSSQECCQQSHMSRSSRIPTAETAEESLVCQCHSTPLATSCLLSLYIIEPFFFKTPPGRLVPLP